MKKLDTPIPGVVILEPRVFEDSRGFFMETWSANKYEELGLPIRFTGDNLSKSTRGVLRGMHFQSPNPQAKLLYVLQGEIFDVAVDIRVGSPGFGRWTSVILSEQNKRQFYLPEGLAHGFCVVSETALVAYKVTDIYNPNAELTLLWNDPEVGIDWPEKKPLLSTKDQNGVLLRDIPRTRLIRY